jgi:hypothetical protein
VTLRPLGPPSFITDDPGPWSVVTHVFHQAGRPGRRRPQPPTGLTLAPPPSVPLELAGLAEGPAPAGAGRARLVAAAREPAFGLWWDASGDVLRGVSPYVLRSWSLPDLAPGPEERPGDDPAAGLPEPVPAAGLAEAAPPPLAEAPGGALRALHVREGRMSAVALVREPDGALVRWIRGARAAAWSPDGALLAVGGEWGVMLLAPAPGGPDA